MYRTLNVKNWIKDSARLICLHAGTLEERSAIISVPETGCTKRENRYHFRFEKRFFLSSKSSVYSHDTIININVSVLKRIVDRRSIWKYLKWYIPSPPRTTIRVLVSIKTNNAPVLSGNRIQWDGQYIDRGKRLYPAVTKSAAFMWNKYATPRTPPDRYLHSDRRYTFVECGVAWTLSFVVIFYFFIATKIQNFFVYEEERGKFSSRHFVWGRRRGRTPRRKRETSVFFFFLNRPLKNVITKRRINQRQTPMYAPYNPNLAILCACAPARRYSFAVARDRTGTLPIVEPRQRSAGDGRETIFVQKRGWRRPTV